MKLIMFPIKKSQQTSKPVLGDICFDWRNVEFVECSKDDSTIIHFYSGKTFKSKKPFIEGRKAFLNGKKTKS